jgi:hypothetical protein
MRLPAAWGVMAVAASHRSGYVRETAVSGLAASGDGRAIRHVLLRLNDWVKEIRRAARSAIEVFFQPVLAPDVIAALPIVGATLARRDRRRAIRSQNRSVRLVRRRDRRRDEEDVGVGLARLEHRSRPREANIVRNEIMNTHPRHRCSVCRSSGDQSHPSPLKMLPELLTTQGRSASLVPIHLAPPDTRRHVGLSR